MGRYILTFFVFCVTVAGFYTLDLKLPLKKEEPIESNDKQTDHHKVDEWVDEDFVETKSATVLQIADMSLGEIEQELKDGREKIKHDNLIERLNKGEASLEELNQANVLFERLALLSLENAHRKAQKLAPEIEHGLDKIDQDLEEIKNMLRY